MSICALLPLEMSKKASLSRVGRKVASLISPLLPTQDSLASNSNGPGSSLLFKFTLFCRTHTQFTL